MADTSDPLRAHLARALDWQESHAGFDRAVDGMPDGQRGARPPGFEHSAWQLLEHLRIAQHDLLDYCVNAAYVHDLKWPDDYWPADPSPPDAGAWDRSLADFRRDRDRLKAVIADAGHDLFAAVPTGKPAHTLLRTILVLIDHNAYHVGQIVAVRRALGAWP